MVQGTGFRRATTGWEEVGGVGRVMVQSECYGTIWLSAASAQYVNSKDFRRRNMLTNAAPHASGPASKLLQRAQYVKNQRAQYVDVENFRGLDM